ncbi:MAG: hypothetical protein U0270_46555 [Labilithrix sp.]
MMSVDEAIAEFLRTGHTDPMYRAWPGSGFMARAERAEDELTDALVAELWKRAVGKSWRDRVQVPEDMREYTRSKVEPMVRGLFARVEHEPILQLLERSAVIVTDDTVEPIVRASGFLSTRWNVVNLYLLSLDADVLGDRTRAAVGFSENFRSYITPQYFEQLEPFVDFLVHECAHVLHDARLETVGLRATRSRERLVELEFRERETFAYACEAYATIAAGRSAAERQDLATQLRVRRPYPTWAVDVAKVETIVSEAAPMRNGWKHVLERCAPAERPLARN